MNPADRYVVQAEQDASPNRFPPGRTSTTEKVEPHEEIARTHTASSTATSLISSSDASGVERDGDMSRLPTQRDDVVDLERHPTALSRIYTQRSQHSETVGGTLKSRTSRKPLPAFGAGKAYPPPLPEREQYVVEFDGFDDPLHAQNCRQNP